MSKNPKQSKNPYQDQTRPELVKALSKLQTDYHQSAAKGKLTTQATSEIRKERARLLTALNKTT